ncbi:MAG: hypothetical protein R3B60_00125 [Candidatus Paceibacterota bacterium]
MNLKNISTEPIGKLVPLEFHNIPWYHFSVDDVFDSLIDLTIKKTPLFDNPFFALMKEIHDEYGAQIDLELFYEKDIDGVLYTLKDVRDLRGELAKDGNWLRFGPHAKNYMTAPFEQTPEEQELVFDKIYNEIDRFAGREYYAKWIRLHYYSESYELASYFKKKDITALFTTDREIGSHRMCEKTAKFLLELGHASYQDVDFIRTQYRIEVFTNSRYSEEDLRAIFLDSLKKYGYIIVYSHEYEFARSEVRNMLRKTFKILSDVGAVSIKH